MTSKSRPSKMPRRFDLRTGPGLHPRTRGASELRERASHSWGCKRRAALRDGMEVAGAVLDTPIDCDIFLFEQEQPSSSADPPSPAPPELPPPLLARASSSCPSEDDLNLIMKKLSAAAALRIGDGADPAAAGQNHDLSLGAGVRLREPESSVRGGNAFARMPPTQSMRVGLSRTISLSPSCGQPASTEAQPRVSLSRTTSLSPSSVLPSERASKSNADDGKMMIGLSLSDAPARRVSFNLGAEGAARHKLTKTTSIGFEPIEHSLVPSAGGC